VTATLAAARAAAAQLASLPLRLGAAGEAADGAKVIARGWIRGLEEAGAVLDHLLGTQARTGAAFSAAWPYAAGEGWLAAPAVPVVATAKTQDAVDGSYRLSEAGVHRETAGVESLLLSTAEPGRPGSPWPFDLLWFSPAARWLLRGGVVEVEDPFCRVTAALTQDRLDALLVRGQRVDAAVLEGLDPEPRERAATLEIRRHVELAGDRWRHPARVLGRRQGVRRVDREGEGLRLRLEGGDEVAASLSESEAGWSAELASGLPWTRAELVAEGSAVVYRVTVAPGLDPLDAGVRTRLAFDLLSDLLGLEKGG